MRQSNRYNPPWERDTGANYIGCKKTVKMGSDCIFDMT